MNVQPAKWSGLLGLLFIIACSKAPTIEVIARFPVDDWEGLLARSGLHLDERVTADGKGALKISVDEAMVIPLYDTGNLDVENGFLVCDAQLRLDNCEGIVYLELLCNFPGRGEYYSRGFDHAASGTSGGWIKSRARFFLREGENPDNVRVNLVMTGPGTAWIDDIRFIATAEG
jgi:hypothetical protein